MKAAPGLPARLQRGENWFWIEYSSVFTLLLKWFKMEVLGVAVNTKCQFAHFKEQGLRNWLNNQFGYEQNFKHRNNLLTPPEGAAPWMFHSVCLTSGLQSRGIVAPPNLDLWETAVSCMCHSDKMFHHLGWISFLAEGPHVQAGERMNGCKLRRGREDTISRVLYAIRSWRLNVKKVQEIIGTNPSICYRLPSLDCVSASPWSDIFPC